jgi:hypothetical protein
MREWYWHTFPTTGYIQYKFTEEELKPLLTEIDEIQSSFQTHTAYNMELAGHLKYEYIIQNSFSYVEQLVKPLALEHIDLFSSLDLALPATHNNLTLKSCWVNFQQKYEFNPIHGHSDLISFVIWCKIPYEQKDEDHFWRHIQDPRKIEKRQSGKFVFTYTDTIGGTRNMPLDSDSSTEYTITVFPSAMLHSVNPFYTSDDYRITVSGNFGV